MELSEEAGHPLDGETVRLIAEGTAEETRDLHHRRIKIFQRHPSLD